MPNSIPQIIEDDPFDGLDSDSDDVSKIKIYIDIYLSISTYRSS